MVRAGNPAKQNTHNCRLAARTQKWKFIGGEKTLCQVSRPKPKSVQREDGFKIVPEK
jgi:hypothetical protein